MNTLSIDGEAEMQVSVVIPAFDEGDLLTAAVDSVVGQTAMDGVDPPNYEIIVVAERGADEATSAVMALLPERDPRIRCLENRCRRGPAGTRNTGIAAARGAWVAFLDGDDTWLPTALVSRWQALKQAPGAGWLATDFHRDERIDPVPTGDGFVERTPALRAAIAATDDERALMAARRPILLPRPVDRLARWCPCSTVTVMVRRDLLVATGGFREGLRRAEDTHLWIRLAARADLLFLPWPTACYRVRPSTLSRRGASLWTWELACQLDLLRRPSLWPWFALLYRDGMVWLLNEHAADLRRRRRFLAAAPWALASAVSWPAQTAAWRNLAGSLLRRP